MSGMNDILMTLKKIKVIIFFAKTDTEARYRRSILGPFWLTLGTLIGVLGLGIVWSQILNIDSHTFIPNLTVGLVCWQLIANTIAESSSLYMRSGSIIKNSPQPYFFFPCLLVSKHIINFIHNFAVIVLVMLYFKVSVNLNTLLVIPALLLVFINLIFLSLILGFLGARFRDLEPTVTAFLPLLFFITPIIYKPSQIKISSWVIDFNPLAYYVNVIRDPLLGTAISAETVIGFMVITCTVVVLGILLLTCKKDKISFWL